MTRPPAKARFVSRPGDPDSWIRAADAPPTGDGAGAAFTARLTIDITPEYSTLPEEGVDFIAKFLPEAKFIYIINIAIAALIYFFFVIAGFSGMGEDVGAGFLAGFGILLFGWIPALLQIVAVRLGLEGMIAVIRIAQNTAAIREANAGR